MTKNLRKHTWKNPFHPFPSWFQPGRDHPLGFSWLQGTRKFGERLRAESQGYGRLGARGTGGWRRLDVASRMEMAWSGACLATFGSDWLASELIHFWIHLALLFRSF